MKVIAVTNRKGGVGKSTISVHIAAGLASMGYNVGLVDTDSQGHASVMLGVERSDSLFELMVDKKPIDECVMTVPPENYSTPDHPSKGSLYLISSFEKTALIGDKLDIADAYLFMDLMDDFIDEYKLHVVIADTSPSLTKLTGNIYMGTDLFLVPTELERLSFEGLQDVIRQTNRFRRARERINRDQSILAIIPNKMRSMTTLHDKNLAYLGEAFPGKVWNALSQRVTWGAASDFGQPIFIYQPSSIAARQAWHLVKRVAQEINSWAETKQVKS